MSIKATEVGKIFRYATAYNLSGNIALSLKFHAPDGTITQVLSPRVTAPAVDVDDPDVGPLAASTYMQFTTQATDFPDYPNINKRDPFLNWTVCGTYEDGTPKIFYGDDAVFPVYRAC